LSYSAFLSQDIVVVHAHLSNAEGVHSRRKVGNIWNTAMVGKLRLADMFCVALLAE